MSAQLCSVPGQTERRRKDFLEWESIDLSYEISLTCGGNVNIYNIIMVIIIKVFIILVLLVRMGNILSQNKSVSSPLK